MTRPWFQSYESGVQNHLDYPEISLPDLLKKNAAKYAANTSMVYLDHSWSYQELNQLVSQMANLLISHQVKPGDRVGIHLLNSPQFIITYYGLLRAGAIAVPINPTSVGDDFRFIIQNSRLKVLFTSSHSLAHIKSELSPDLKVFVTDTLSLFGPSQNYSLDPSISAIRLEQALFSQPVTDPGLTLNPDAPANLQYTGGTTGRSKGAILSHRNLIANAVQIREWFRNVYQDGESGFLSVIPLFHIFGLTTTMNLPILSGSSILLYFKFDLPEMIRIIETYKPHLFMGVPAMYAAFVMRQEHPDLTSIRACISGSAPLPLAIQQKFEQLTGGKLVEGYGLTEAAPVVCCNPIYGVVKNGSIGLPFPDTEVKVVDPQNGREVQTFGEVGELLVKGPQVMKGYWEQPEETAQVFQDGWLRTGDLVRMDEGGYIYITDRLKDMIISGGEKVYPREVEELLYKHPAVKEAAVIGIPHSLRGEVVEAYVVLKEDAAADAHELKHYCAQHLTKYKVPHSFKFIDTLPRSSVGKILKQALREKVQ